MSEDTQQGVLIAAVLILLCSASFLALWVMRPDAAALEKCRDATGWTESRCLHELTR